jgi:hypothetical protein
MRGEGFWRRKGGVLAAAVEEPSQTCSVLTIVDILRLPPALLNKYVLLHVDTIFPIALVPFYAITHLAKQSPQPDAFPQASVLPITNTNSSSPFLLHNNYWVCQADSPVLSNLIVGRDPKDEQLHQAALSAR